LSGAEPVLKLQSSATSPIIDPHLSPDGSMIAYVRDDELHTVGFSDGQTTQLTYGASESGKVLLWSSVNDTHILIGICVHCVVCYHTKSC
jgi:hypothetical protein